MTPRQVELIRESWTSLEPVQDVTAALFYARLVELDPALGRLFRNADMDQQNKILMQTLTVVVKSLDRLDQLVPAIEALGRRHAGYGVRADHYETGGTALLWALSRSLGEAFTPETEHAWTVTFSTLASVMIGAAQGEAVAA